MRKEMYEVPVMELVELECEDVIMTSQVSGETTEDEE